MPVAVMDKVGLVVDEGGWMFRPVSMTNIDVGSTVYVLQLKGLAACISFKDASGFASREIWCRCGQRDQVRPGQEAQNMGFFANLGREDVLRASAALEGGKELPAAGDEHQPDFLRRQLEELFQPREVREMPRSRG